MERDRFERRTLTQFTGCKMSLKTLGLAIAIAICSVSTAFAMEMGPILLTAKIKSFNEKTVTAENEVATYEIPRKLIEPKSLKSGEEVSLALSSAQADEVKSTLKKK